MAASLRFLFRERRYSVLVIGTLALAVGANLVVFTIVNTLWLRPRPIADPDRVVMVSGDAGATSSMELNDRDLDSLLRPIPAFGVVAGQGVTDEWRAALKPRLVIADVGHEVETLAVTPEYFDLLGVAVRGRTFTRDDDHAGADPVAIISDRLWRSAFGAKDVVGATVSASPFRVRIIGIAPTGFSGARLGEQVDVWIPHLLEPAAAGMPTMAMQMVPLAAIARLAPGYTADAAARLLAAEVARNAALTRQGVRLSVVPLSQLFGSPDHKALLINEGPVVRVIAVTSLLVLLGGCATLVALVFVHYERRRSEFAIRLALGASRLRLARRLVAELGWLATLGASTAILLASWCIRVTPALDLPNGVNLGRIDLGLDWRVLIGAIATTVVTMSAAAALPLARFTRGGLARSLVSGSATASTGSLRLRKVMLATHVAATVVALVAAGLFVRTVEYGLRGGAGFDVDKTVFVAADVSNPYARNAAIGAAQAHDVDMSTLEKYEAVANQIEADLAAHRVATTNRLLQAIGALPGTELTSIGAPPLSTLKAAEKAAPTIVVAGDVSRSLQLGSKPVGPDYERVLGLVHIAGRMLTAADDRRFTTADASPRSALITASLAATLWPGESSIGREFRAADVRYLVVGVVSDVAYGSLRFSSRAAILTAARPDVAMNTMNVAIRTSSPDALAAEVRQLLTGDADVSRLSISTGRELVEADLGRERLGAWFFSGFGLVGLALGVGGIFGFVAYLVESRRREFGVRIALGGTSRDLIRLAMTSGLVPVAIGAVLGSIGAIWIGKAAESLLVGVSPFDVATFAGAPALMLVVAAAAGAAAAWRIHRLSPVEALRAE